MSMWDDKPNDYDHAVRLLKSIRAETIEECAQTVQTQVLDKLSEGQRQTDAYDTAIAALTAIRALKDKP